MLNEIHLTNVLPFDGGARRPHSRSIASACSIIEQLEFLGAPPPSLLQLETWTTSWWNRCLLF